jgi:hypothetical protein
MAKCSGKFLLSSYKSSGKITLKSNGDEALSDESPGNNDEALNDVFP